MFASFLSPEHWKIRQQDRAVEVRLGELSIPQLNQYHRIGTSSIALPPNGPYSAELGGARSASFDQDEGKQACFHYIRVEIVRRKGVLNG